MARVEVDATAALDASFRVFGDPGRLRLSLRSAEATPGGGRTARSRAGDAATAASRRQLREARRQRQRLALWCVLVVAACVAAAVLILIARTHTHAPPPTAPGVVGLTASVGAGAAPAGLTPVGAAAAGTAHRPSLPTQPSGTQVPEGGHR